MTQTYWFYNYWFLWIFLGANKHTQNDFIMTNKNPIPHTAQAAGFTITAQLKCKTSTIPHYKVLGTIPVYANQ